MNEIRWIKLSTDLFNNRKIKMIESMPDGDAMVVIWMKILILAGNVNDNGVIYFTPDIPYTEQMLATEFNRPLSTIQLALSTFQQFGMIDIVNNFIQVSNWEKYQNIEGMDKIREQNRIRQKRWYDNQKSLPNVRNNVRLTQPNATEEDKDIDKDIDKEKEKNIEYQHYADMYNEICISFPKVTSLSDSRKKAIKARLNKYSEEQIRKAFEKAQASSFLKGGNNRNWMANFDWMMKDANIAKILDGNYDDKKRYGANGIELGDDYDHTLDEVF